ncbi:MAG: hypothetical protein ACLFTN_09580 [Phycisphaerae bacterium]
MRSDRTRWIQAAWLGVALVLMAGAGWLRASLSEQRGRIGSERRQAMTRERPEVALLALAPGGLRAPVVNYLWTRIEDLKQKGRYYEAMQLSEWITSLQPRFAGVWSFHAWNMAWNISVATHTPEERWLWVSNGMKLLRNRAIPTNPQALVLYKELAWLLFSKMGGTTDDMHMVYKSRWAGEMQQLLGAPPAGTTQEVIDAFRPIAEVPAGRSPEDLRADPAVAAYLKKLTAHDIAPNATLLAAYNRWSLDEPAAVVRLGRVPKPETDRDRAVSALINTKDAADREALDRLLATVRAHILRTEYRMDPQWMLALMERFDAPFDWRLVWPHGLYWVTQGLHTARGLRIREIDSLNTQRQLLNCLKFLTFEGRMMYAANPNNPATPEVRFYSDWRYIQPAHREHVRLIKADLGKPNAADDDVDFTASRLGDGHRNFLVNAISMLEAGGQIEEAQQLLNWTRYHYKEKGGIWRNVLVRPFVDAYLEREGSPIPRVAISRITTSLQTAFLHLTRPGPDAQAGYRRYIDRAQAVHSAYQKDVAARVKLPPLGLIARDVLVGLLIEPRAFGYDVSLVERSTMYQALPESYLVGIYDVIAPFLRRQCEAQDPPLDFPSAFPEPDGLEEYRKRVREQFSPEQKDPAVKDEED